MSEDYKLQVSLFLPPVGQYAKGDMLNIRADDADELYAALDSLFGVGASERVLGRFNEATLVALGFERPTADIAGTPDPGLAARAGACPDCEVGNLVEKERKDGKGKFVGCNRFPSCRYIQRG